MMLFAFPLYDELAETLGRLSGLEHGRFTVGRFPNRELHAKVETSPEGRDCIVLGSVAPPDESLLSTLLLSHTLKKERALSVIALLPYLGYSRGDRVERGKSLATAWLGELLGASGIDEVVTIDLHSPLAHQLFPIPLHSLSPAMLFAEAIAALRLTDATVVAPDQGALERCEAVRQAAGIEQPLAHLTKARTEAGIVHSTLQGRVGSQAIVVDDILDTGSTLVSACEALLGVGVQEIIIMVTHGLFTGAAWERLWSLGVRRIYCTDTLPLPKPLASQQISILSVAPLLSEYLNKRPEKGR